MESSTSRHQVFIALGTLLFASACGGGIPLPDVGVTNLGHLGDGYASAYRVSEDGRVVVGSSRVDKDYLNPFRWTLSGITNLATLSGLSGRTSADGVSADGVVFALTDHASHHAYRWTENGGKVDLGSLGGMDTIATGLSSDGAVVVGNSSRADSNWRAFRWTQSGGMVELSGGGPDSSAAAASADGSVVVGAVSSFVDTDGDGMPDLDVKAARWTQSGGMVSLGALGGSISFANGVSGDGSVVVGQSSTTNGKSHAFRWTQSGGMVDLGTLESDDWADYTESSAEGVSADGKVVVGFVKRDSGETIAFRWTQKMGMQTINEWAGLRDSITFNSANSTNRDGSIVVGTMNGTQAVLVRSGL